MSGRVVLVGAGPGDPDLLTLRAARELREAEVLLYDALLEPALVALGNPEAVRIDVGKRGDGSKGFPQDRIAELMIEHARAGRHVVRLKGGDPFVFGRGGEEASALAAAGVPFEVVPGVSSALAVPSYAGIPVTDRRVAGSMAIVSGHRGGPSVDWEGLARAADTLVILMGTRWLAEIAERAIAGGVSPDTPAAVIASGATARQKVVEAPLSELASRVARAGLQAPTVIVIGEVARFRPELAWFERRPLFGRRVLITRAAPEGAELVARLAALGAEPVWVPLLEIVPSDAPEEASARLSRVDDDWLVFTSRNAVRHAAPALDPRVFSGESRTRIACVGDGTAALARAEGLAVSVVPEKPSGGRALAAAIAGSAGAGGSVLFACGADALDALPRELEARGFEVERLVVYANRMPEEAPARLRKEVERGLDALLLMSPSAVERLVGCLDGPSFLDLAKRAALACVGPTTAEALRAHDVEPAVVADPPGADSLLRALERYPFESRREERDGLA